MKKIICICLIISIVFALFVGCVSNEKELETKNPTPNDMYITSGGETIYPKSFGVWGHTWDKEHKGWLADSFYTHFTSFDEYRDELPSVTLSNDISIPEDMDFSFAISKEEPDSKDGPDWKSESGENFNYQRFSEMDSGTYYVKISAVFTGDYVPEGKDYNKWGYDFFFALIVP